MKMTMRKSHLSLLVALLLLPALLAVWAVAPRARVAAQATFAPSTPRPDGSVVHIVQPGETMWVIAINYAGVLGMAPEDALPHLQELNNNPTFVNPNDEIIIIPANLTPTTDPATATAEAATTPEAPGEGTAASGEGAAGATPAPDATAEAPAETLAGTICVGAFHDANADGQRNEGETLVADAAIALAQAGTTTSTYITDGASEPYCFELTEADSYTLQLYPPAGFAATTEDNWAVSIANGESYTVSFGLTDAPEAVAEAPVDTSTEPTTGDTTAGEEAAAEDGGLPGNLGVLVIAVAAVLILLAVVGVVLLRRG
jgi:hypothetical protein